MVALTIDEEGQARTREHKVAIAERLIADLTGRWGMSESDIVVDCLTFPIATGQEETRRDGIETIEAIRELKRRHPDVHTTLGVSNVSFGLNPAARQVLNSVFLAECTAAGLDSAIVHPSKILPMARIPEEQRTVALDLVYDRRRGDYDPLQKVLELFDGATTAAGRATRAAELLLLPLDERLQRRIIDGERNGLEADLDEAMQHAVAAGDHQRHPARGHEDGRRAVRLRRHAAAVRAHLGRGDEAGGRLPGTAHGEGRLGAARAPSCWPPSRATCTTSARTWSTSSCPTTATRW